jgi:serine/threonine-protein kinase
LSTLDGTLVGERYRLETQVGSGGMSTVHRALDEKLGRPVAVKLMHRTTAADSDHLERFRREARAVANLSHPHLVGVIDAGEDEGRPFIVFEFVAGETLKARIRRNGRLEIPEAVAYAIEVARGLAIAHDHGIVHRDVKPQNILIDQDGHAKLTDFGIARSLDEDGLTADGRVLGTTDYVSPEQALGQTTETASDIYSLGIVLFEMLTGDVPFKAENPIGVAMCHVRDPMPDVRSARPDISATLASIVDRCTAKEPSDRYPDCASLAQDLEEALTLEASRAGQAAGEATSVIETLPGEAKSRVPAHVRSPRRRLATIAGLILLLGAGGAVLAFGLQRGTGTHEPSQGGFKQVSLASDAAVAYDPFGDGAEHSADAKRVLDGDPATTWESETYFSGFQKAGVGMMLDARPSFNARAVEFRTATPGFTFSIWGANGPQPQAKVAGTGPAGGTPGGPPPGSWTRLSGDRQAQQRTFTKLTQPTKRWRWYLIWATSLGKGHNSVSLAEAALLG